MLAWISTFRNRQTQTQRRSCPLAFFTALSKQRHSSNATTSCYSVPPDSMDTSYTHFQNPDPSNSNSSTASSGGRNNTAPLYAPPQSNVVHMPSQQQEQQHLMNAQSTQPVHADLSSANRVSYPVASSQHFPLNQAVSPYTVHYTSHAAHIPGPSQSSSLASTAHLAYSGVHQQSFPPQPPRHFHNLHQSVQQTIPHAAHIPAHSASSHASSLNPSMPPSTQAHSYSAQPQHVQSHHAQPRHAQPHNAQSQQTHRSHQRSGASDTRSKEALHEARRQRLRELRKEFFSVPLLENKYSVQQVIGEGASGVVCSAVDNTTGEVVAVKRICKGFNKVPVAIRILRELKFLRLLRGHENIVEMKEILLPDLTKDFQDVFVVFELMPTDLNHILRSKTPLSALHVQYFMYQLFRGLHFIHSAGVFHRDLKPNNILINNNCSLRICDFGLARAAFDDSPDLVYWTDYVATRWYRAPELILTHFTKYSTAIDIWSAGCIFAEMLGRGKPLFPGKNAVEQLNLITSIVGSPSKEAIAKVQSPRAREHFSSLPHRPRRPFKERFPKADELACDLLEKLLEFDPAKRPSALEALQHPYFKEFFGFGNEASGKPIDSREFDFEREKKTSADRVRQLFMDEILLYHPEHSRNYLQDSTGEDVMEFGPGLVRAVSGLINSSHPDRSSPGLERPSQAEAFARGMRSVQEGIEQRKSTSLPETKLEPLNQAYRAKLRGRRVDATPGESSAGDSETRAANDYDQNNEAVVGDAMPMDDVNMMVNTRGMDC